MSDLAYAPPAPHRAPNMIAIASGKGGVGKTWLSITLSQEMALRGQRVLLFDGDLGLANVDVQLGIAPAHDLGEVAAGALPMARAVEAYPAGGFDVLAGRSGAAGMANMAPQRLQALREDLLGLAEGYGAVVVDLGAGIDRTVQFLGSPAGVTLVVTTDEPTALTDAYALIKTTRARAPDADLRLVVNMAGTVEEGRRTHAAIAQVCRNFLRFDLPLMGVIRRDQRVRDAIRAQMPLLTRTPLAPSAEDVSAIAARLLHG